MKSEEVKQLRKENGFKNQEDFAIFLGCSSSTVKNHEQGRPSRYLELLIKEALTEGKLKRGSD